MHLRWQKLKTEIYNNSNNDVKRLFLMLTNAFIQICFFCAKAIFIYFQGHFHIYLWSYYRTICMIAISIHTLQVHTTITAITNKILAIDDNSKERERENSKTIETLQQMFKWVIKI